MPQINSLGQVIKDYICTCPDISASDLNFIEVTTADKDIEGKPIDSVVKHYIGGGAVKQIVFLIGCDVFCEKEIKDGQLYNNLSSWLENENRSGKLPVIMGANEGHAISIKVVGQHFLTDEEGNRKYQIQIKLIYMQKA